MNCYLWAIIVNVVIAVPLSLTLPRRHQLALQHPEVSELRAEEHSQLDPLSPEDAKNYLQKYGHIAPSNVLGANVLGRSRAENREDLREVLRKGIMSFQSFAGLPQTGEIDEETATKMTYPRCGVADVLSFRVAGSYQWPKHALTYSFLSFTPDLPQQKIKEAIRKAFKVWSAVTPLTFKEVPQGGNIKIKFANHSHGDPWPFDGHGGVLAHATMPTNGLLHFDEDENWVYMDAEKLYYGNQFTDILTVAVHEIGHTLGLDHSRNQRSVMAPFYQSAIDEYGNYVVPKLDSEDIEKIQDIYGAPVEGTDLELEDDTPSSDDEPTSTPLIPSTTPGATEKPPEDDGHTGSDKPQSPTRRPSPEDPHDASPPSTTKAPTRSGGRRVPPVRSGDGRGGIVFTWTSWGRGGDRTPQTGSSRTRLRKDFLERLLEKLVGEVVIIQVQPILSIV